MVSGAIIIMIIIIIIKNDSSCSILQKLDSSILDISKFVYDIITV